MKITINETISMHEACINNLNTIQQMEKLEKEFSSKEATRIKNKAIDQYADFIRLLCEPHIEYALSNDENYSAVFLNILS